MKKIKLNLKKWHKIVLGIIGIGLFLFGMTDGIEWYRILSVLMGGFIIGVVTK